MECFAQKNLNSRKRTGLETNRDTQAALARPLTRRRFIAAGLGMLLGGIPATYAVRSLTSEDAPLLYDGPIEYMHGQPELNKGDLAALANELERTESPMFMKAARDLRAVTGKESVTSVPAELIKPTAFPLEVTENKATPKSEMVLEPEKASVANPKFHFITPEGKDELHHFENSYNAGIILGTKDYDKNSADFAKIKAMLTTKEVLTLTSIMRYASEAYDFYSNQGNFFLDENRSLINDPVLQRRAGIAKLLHSMGDEKGMPTTDFLVFDGLPIKAVAYAVEDCIARKKFHPSAIYMNRMDIVSNHMHDSEHAHGPDVYEQATALFDTWASQGDLLPQPGLTGAVFSKGSPLRKAIIGFQNEIYGYNLHD